MKHTLVLLLGFLSGVQALSAQNSPDCRSAIPVCADTVRTWFADGGGDIDDFDPDVIRQSGCLEKGSNTSANIENNTSWFVFRAGTGGQIGFDIEALPGATGTVTAEWDFALYGPDVDCADISNGTAQPIRCNYEVNDTRFTGVGINPENGQAGAPFLIGSQNTYDEFLEVQPGEIYYLLINNYNTNFDGDPEPYTLTFTGNSVNTNQDTALDCTLRDEFLGLDITACEGDPDIVLSALNSPAGPDITDIAWSVDYDDDGTIDANLASGPGATELIVSSPNSGRYYVEITATTSEVYTDDILITYYGEPQLDRVDILSDLSDSNNIEIIPVGDGDYEYAINGGEFQESPIFNDVPPGINTVIINDRNGCGTTEPIEFLVIGYPKFFTPNADGIHDTWHILGIEQLTEPVVFIFDRYGKLLKQIDETSVGWDGNFNGRPLPSSDYWFRLEYSRDDQGVLVANLVRAHFTLKR
ncbi:T9SS type B sorting domain-containing protein [Robiginitalea sp. SC105]|uniref:T9SS type B sorting domain-containing protein n=1 Tax=Robiginitalea sp. SC105 TaxID=2762332 RepID=UPI00163A6EED|nr:T9SS type B sorting domain-containing protein [Robiginitalea sp. SC105]MBC2839765.1 T9SS type B sorting domain-containing protein [Robiginitalea sp. SC105]